MTDHVLNALNQRLDDLRAKLKAREGVPGFEANTNEIREAIEQLEAEVGKRMEAPSE